MTYVAVDNTSHISIPTAREDVFGPWDETSDSFSECVDEPQEKITLPPLLHTSPRKGVAHSAVLHQGSKRNSSNMARISVSAYDSQSAKLKANTLNSSRHNIGRKKSNPAWNKHLSVGLGNFLNNAHSPNPSSPSALTKVDIVPNQLPRYKSDFLASRSPSIRSRSSKPSLSHVVTESVPTTMYYHDSFNTQYQHVALRNGPVGDKDIDLKKIYDKAYRPTLKLPKCTSVTTIKPQFINGTLPINKICTSQKAIRKQREGLGNMTSCKYKPASSISSGDSEEYFRGPDSGTKYLKTYTRKKVAMFNSMSSLSRITYSVPQSHWDYRK